MKTNINYIEKVLRKKFDPLKVEYIRTLNDGLSCDAHVFLIGDRKYVFKSTKRNDNGTLASESLQINSLKQESIISSELHRNNVSTPVVMHHVDDEFEYTLQLFILGAKTMTNETIVNRLKFVAKTLTSMHSIREINNIKTFEAKELYAKYLSLLPTSDARIEKYKKTQRLFNLLVDKVDSFFLERKVCHNDALAANFIVDAFEYMHIIDHEYTAFNYPLWDLTSVIVESKLNSDDQEMLIDEYVKRNSYSELAYLRKFEPCRFTSLLLAVRLIQDHLWSLWGYVKSINPDNAEVDKSLVSWADEKSVSIEDFQRIFKSVNPSISRFDYSTIHTAHSKASTEYINVSYNGALELSSDESYEDHLYITNSVWTSNKIVDAKKLSNYIIDVERTVLKRLQFLKNDSVYHKRIIVEYLKLIDSIASGLDVRSKWSTEELAERLVNWYVEKIDKIETKYNELLIQMQLTPMTYMDNWREFDNYHRDVDTYELTKFPPKLDDLYKYEGSIEHKFDSLMLSTKDMLIAIIDLNELAYNETSFFEEDTVYRFMTNDKKAFYSKIEKHNGQAYTLASLQYKATSIKSRKISNNSEKELPEVIEAQNFVLDKSKKRIYVDNSKIKQTKIQAKLQ